MKDQKDTTELKAAQDQAVDVDALFMCEFTQGDCEDGSAIKKNGKPISIEEILVGLRLVSEWKAMGVILRAMPGNKQIESAYMLSAFEKKVDEFLST